MAPHDSHCITDPRTGLDTNPARHPEHYDIVPAMDRTRVPARLLGPGRTIGRVEVTVRLVDPADGSGIEAAARALHDFNVEFDTPTPGAEVLAGRLAERLDGSLFVVLASDRAAGSSGTPVGTAVGVAVVSLRPNVWFDGPVALLDELYVRPERRNGGVGGRLIEAVRREVARRGVEHLEIAVDEGDVDARRFYERLGFSHLDADSGERAFVYWSAVSADPRTA